MLTCGWRTVRGDVAKGTADLFFHEVKFWRGEPQEAPPIFSIDDVHYMYLLQNGLYFVATTRSNTSGSFVLEVISRIARVFKDYCGVLSEEAIRQNFVLIYELLDEMIDFGFPQDTSTELLKVKCATSLKPPILTPRCHDRRTCSTNPLSCVGAMEHPRSAPTLRATFSADSSFPT